MLFRSTKLLSSVEIQTEADVSAVEEMRKADQIVNMQFTHQDLDRDADEDGDQPFKRSEQKTGRNDACPCGSGKKYKVCHGKLG